MPGFKPNYLMQDYLFVKDGVDHFQVFFAELQYIEAMKRYVRFVTTDRIYMTQGSLYQVENKLPVDQFCRIHRSYIVSLRHARHLNARVITVGGSQIPIGRSYRGILWTKILVADQHKIIQPGGTGYVIQSGQQ